MVEEVPFTDIYIDETIVERAVEVLNGKRWVKGPEVEAFEAEFAEAVGAEHAVGVSNGTSALLLAMDSLGIGPGDEIFVPGHTFFATVSPILSLGATPVFVDVDQELYTMDPDHLRECVRAASRPAAILPVHLYGQVVEMEAIGQIATEHDLVIVEDACQAHLAARAGQFAGTFGKAGGFSFYPSKNMAVGGDGGMIVTDDPELAKSARARRNHGRDNNGEHVELGLNHRLDEIKGAIGREQLAHLPGWREDRAAAAAQYSKRLSDIPEVSVPTVGAEVNHAFHLYVIQVDDRDALVETLEGHGIQTGIHYGKPVYRHAAITDRVEAPSLPVTESVVDRILSLPMHPRITIEELEYVCDVIEDHYQQR